MHNRNQVPHNRLIYFQILSSICWSLVTPRMYYLYLMTLPAIVCAIICVQFIYWCVESYFLYFVCYLFIYFITKNMIDEYISCKQYIGVIIYFELIGNITILEYWNQIKSSKEIPRVYLHFFLLCYLIYYLFKKGKSYWNRDCESIYYKNNTNKYLYLVVVVLPSETYGRNGVTPIFRSFHRTDSSTTGAGVVGTF